MKRVESGKVVLEAVRKAAGEGGGKVLWISAKGGALMERAEEDERGGNVMMERAEEDERGGDVLMERCCTDERDGNVMMERAEEDERGVDLWVFTGARGVESAFDAIVNNGPSVLLDMPTTSATALPRVDRVLMP